MGTINALGHDVDQTWSALVAGTSGVGPITQFDASDMLVQIACEVKGFDPTQHLEAREARRRDRFEQFATVVASQALEDAAFSVGEHDPRRVGVLVASAVGGLASMEDGVETLLQDGPRRVSPFMIPMFMPNGASGLIAIDTGIKGPCFSVASACASGADAIGQAWQLIRFGALDAALAGSSEATVTRIGLACFDRMGALSRRNDEPDRTPAPFDAERDGFVMGEGAAILVLESLENARRRGARILAEMVGYGSSADAYHVTAPAESGEGGAQAMETALATAGAAPEEVDYINAHGTGTSLNDAAETRAIKSVLGDHAYSVAVSSTKSMTGHMMGATGALEGIVCIQAIRQGVIPPTIHYRTPDPECDLDYVPNEARQAPVDLALSNAFGFGGHNAVLAFRGFRD